MTDRKVPEERGVIRIDGAGYSCSKQLWEWMLFHVSAEMQKLIGYWTELYAYSGTRFCLLELFDKMWVLHE